MVKLNHHQRDDMRKILDSLSFDKSILLSDINAINITQYVKDLLSIHEILKINYKIDLLAHKKLQIKEFIQQRCDDLINNKK